MGRNISTKIGIIAVLSVFVCIFASTSFAQPQGRPGGPGRGGFIQRFDTDQDGRVSADEYMTSFNQLDTSGDGYVDEAEAPKRPQRPKGGPDDKAPRGKGQGAPPVI